MDRSRIETYANGGPKLVAAYEGLASEDLLAAPKDGTWSLQQIAIHLLDSDLIASDRMKRIAAMDKPLLCGYDETAFNLLPGVNDLNAHQACEFFSFNRRSTAIILRGLPDDSFKRYGIHTEKGRVTLQEMVDMYIDHLEHHLRFVKSKRSLLGKAR